MKDSRLDRITEGLARAYTKPSHLDKRPDKWISYIDENSLLWFDEYPLENGDPTLVLNGHIFAVECLHQAWKFYRDEYLLDLIQAGLTTMRYSVQRFRRSGKVNIYSLNNTPKSDYLPRRTVRQQCELFVLSGDVFFKNMASTFYRDIGPNGGWDGSEFAPLLKVTN